MASPSSVTVMSGLALEVAVNRWLKPAFEAASPWRLEIDWRPTTAIMKSIAEGQRADVVIAINGSMDKLCAGGIVLVDGDGQPLPAAKVHARFELLVDAFQRVTGLALRRKRELQRAVESDRRLLLGRAAKLETR